MRNIIYGWLIVSVFFSCSEKHNQQEQAATPPQVTNGGQKIEIFDKEGLSLFQTEKISSSNITADITAPAKIAATILASGEGASQNIILFENPELAGSYTLLIQHQSNVLQIQTISIKQKQIELERIRDLQLHGAATGQDLLNAQSSLAMEQTNLANEKAAIIEHEAKLVGAGFNAELLRKSPAGTAYVICDIPENQVSKIQEGTKCFIRFTAFPNEVFTGKIEHIADVVDNDTRMIKLRITLNNSTSKLKAGMFATVSFKISEGNYINIHQNTLITVQGKNYVFVKTNERTFERKEIQIGQQIGDRIIVFSGINEGDEVVTTGVMQLKGLSFGY
jgi:multidrug efflux pump subunit AcrA (membrane-fusion protein)